jgi:hypothetical protein
VPSARQWIVLSTCAAVTASALRFGSDDSVTAWEGSAFEFPTLLVSVVAWRYVDGTCAESS